MKALDVVGIGSGCVDFIHAPEEMLVCPGGAVANTLFSLQKLGLKTGYIGRIGSDRNGKMFAESMREAGTDLSMMKVNGKTAVCSIKVSPKKRTIRMMRFFKSIEKLERKDLEYLAGSDAVFMRVSSIVFKQVAEFCKARGKMLFVTLHELDRKTDLSLLMNGSVRVVFSGKHRLPLLEPYLKDMLNNETVVVLTKGGEGCEVLAKDGHISLDSAGVKPVDPTGAGDAFAAGFVYGFMKKWTLEKCANLANRMGGIAVTMYGARTAIESAERIPAMT